MRAPTRKKLQDVAIEQALADQGDARPSG